jgi:S-adenosylmethionine-diacylgycerolhomoserine-N-methlytransferase
MGFLDDADTLRRLLFTRVRGATHQDRLDAFYRGQASGYDAFRQRLLQGREDLVSLLPLHEGAVWVDLGGGTGANLAMAGERLAALQRAYIVDLCPSLAQVARERIKTAGWRNVVAVEEDATKFQPIEGKVDIVTFSYSLTMVPDWFDAIEHALALLKPGGVIGAVDFYVPRKFPAPGLARRHWLQRNFWPVWFGADNVWLSQDHLPYLRGRTHTLHLAERLAKVPYFPLLRVPYYVYLGKTQVS